MAWAFPKLTSYNRFVELMPSAFIPLFCFLHARRGKCSGISFIDSTSIAVCHNRRIHAHKVFRDLAARGKTSVDWFFGFKLHLVINDCGELLAVRLTPGNADDRAAVPTLARDLFGKLSGDSCRASTYFVGSRGGRASAGTRSRPTGCLHRCG
jgi:hypothetical protein